MSADRPIMLEHCSTQRRFRWAVLASGRSPWHDRSVGFRFSIYRSIPGIVLLLLAGEAGAGPCGAITIKGCCNGPVLQYCSAGALKQADCSTDPKCGWNAQLNYYSCGTLGGSDPSGKHPKVCPTSAGDGGGPVDAQPADLAPAGDSFPPQPDGAPDLFVNDSVIINPGDLAVHAVDSGVQPPGDSGEQPAVDPGGACGLARLSASSPPPVPLLLFLLLPLLVLARLGAATRSP